MAQAQIPNKVFEAMAMARPIVASGVGDMRRGRGWDGPVLYYALLLDYPGVDPFLKSGIWSEDIDIDKNVTLELD